MKKAFSLMELMIVIVILGLLAGLVLPNLIGRGESAKVKLTCIQMKTIGESLKMFKVDLGSFPTTEQGLKALLTNPEPEKYKSYPKGGYLDGKNMPKDPWGSEYIYINDGHEYDIISLGSDKAEGGSDDAEDIYLSKCER